MDRWVGRVAIVTGSSTGIGASIAKKLADLGLVVAGFSRREQTGKRDNVYNVQCDVTDQNSVENAFQWVKTNLGPVQVLVNNAGIFKLDLISSGDPVNFKKIIDTNVFGVVLCCNLAIKQMRENDLEGHIVNINSLAGHKVIKLDPPTFNIYSPTKFAVSALTNVLGQEFAHLKAKIKISSVSPGLVSDTDIFEVAGFSKERRDVLSLNPHIKSEDVADAVVYVLGTPPNVQISELTINAIGESY